MVVQCWRGKDGNMLMKFFRFVYFFLNTLYLNVSLEELWLVGVDKDLLALLDEFLDDAALGLQLQQRLLLSLNQLVHILHAGRGDVSECMLM